jgi:hypothetical protein
MLSDVSYFGIVAMGVSGLLVDAAVTISPQADTANFFAVEEITATRSGDTAVLQVAREIKLPIEMGFTVRVLEYASGGVREFCQMSAAPFQYQPDAVLPDLVTLEWWTHGKCGNIPDGRTRVVTTWAPTHPSYQPVTYSFEIPERGKE